MILEWKRAITILIISFVVLNIFMVVNVWFREQPIAEFVLTSNQKSEIEKSLERCNTGGRHPERRPASVFT